MRPKDPALADRARTLAGEIRKAVVAAADADAFEKSAKAVPHGPELEVRVEKLPPFTRDGAIIEGNGGMDEVFANAAFEVPSVDATSPVVETANFGWHVIRLLERIPENRVPFETRRRMFAEEVFAIRGHELAQAHLKRLRDETGVEISSAAEQLMRSVSTSTDTPSSRLSGAP
jgi:peptidyl-prolyl cis-trans isomerase C